MAADLNAEQFVAKLETYRSREEAKKYQRLFKGEEVMGVRMGQVFTLAKAFIDMSLNEIEKLLDSPLHEVRVGAVSVMDYQARDKKTSTERKKNYLT